MITLREQFQKELKNLHKMLLKMNTAVKTNIDTLIVAISSNNRILARQVIEADDFVDNLEIQIETMCMNILIRQRPVATDLLELLATFKMTTDIERISDYCSSICEHFLKIQSKPNQTCVEKIINLANNAKQMFSSTIDSYLEQNETELQQIIAKDSISDKIYDELELFITNNFVEIGNFNAINFILIGRNLERMADHITNVCNWILFKITGRFQI